MVIGNGMIAKRFDEYKTDNRFVIFASGVSNSKIADDAAYNREWELLKSTLAANSNKTIVYFSTCSFYDPEEEHSRYVQHKQQIEEYIQATAARYYIFRVSNLVGQSGNPNTILNFFVYHIRQKINFDLWINTTRNLLDIDDLYNLAGHILEQTDFLNRIINIANPVSYTVINIIAAIEKHLGIKASYIPIQKGSHFAIDTSAITSLLKKLNTSFSTDYLTNLLKKYYPQ